MKHILTAIGLTAFLGTSLAFAHPHKTNQGPHKAPYEKIIKDEMITQHDIDPSANRTVKIVSKIKNSDDSDRLSTTLEQHFKNHSDKIQKKIERAETQRERAVEKYSKSLKLDNLDVLQNPENLRGFARNLEGLLAESGVISNYTDMFVDILEDVDIQNNEEGLSLNFDGKTLGRLHINGDIEERIGLEAFGRNMTVDKNVITKNGKTKTRIIIEMDGGDDVKIDIKPKSTPSEF